MAESEIRVLIADDEPGIRMILRKMVEKAPGFTVVGEAKNGKEVLILRDQLQPQVIFLDVDMPEISGVECAYQIQDIDPSCVLIFATGHQEYMLDAFSVYAFDYLIKPFQQQRVLNTLERVKRRVRHASQEKRSDISLHTAPAIGREKMMLRHKEGVSFLDRDDILLIQREDRATVIYAKDGQRFATNETLVETHQKLDPTIFFRCHKSYIINLNHIKDITPYGRWTYVVRLHGTDKDALITSENYDMLVHGFSSDEKMKTEQ